MASVVFLKGVNVGGHRTFRPSVLAKQLKRLDVVNIGAAGTFVVRKPVSRLQLRGEFARRLPFEAEIMICDGRDILRLIAADPFAGQPSGPLIIHFVSVLARRQSARVAIPLSIPESGQWGLRVLSCSDRFVLGMHRREMKALSYFGQLERMFGAPLTTRNWNTMLAISRVLQG